MKEDSKQFISRYEIISILGQGGYGTVYRALDPHLNKTVAIKVIDAFSSSNESLVRFQNEAKTLQKIRSTQIPEIFTYGVSENDQPYIVMEYVEGISLNDEISKNGALEVSDAIEIVKSISNILAYSHSHGVYHRDLKPANIILEDYSKNHSVKVIDFGLAKTEHLSKEEIQFLTKTGKMIGSPPYMSPEQINGKKIDGRSDIYSLGCLFYEILTGKRMFDGNTPFAILTKHHSQAPPNLESFPEELGQIVAKCVAKDPDNRYQSMVELKEALEHINLEDPELNNDPKNDNDSALQTKKRPRKPVAIVFALILIAILSLCVKTLIFDEAKKEMPLLGKKSYLEDLADERKLSHAEIGQIIKSNNELVVAKYFESDDYLLNEKLPKSQKYKFDNTTISAAGINKLSEDVTALTFEHCEIDSETWKVITSNFPNLSKLTLLRNNDLPERALEELVNVKKLSGLKLVKQLNNSVTGNEIKEICQLKNLFSLAIQGDQIKANEIRELKNLPNLTHLFLQEMEIDGAAAQEISKLKGITNLTIADSKCSSDALKFISKMKLDNLDLRIILTSKDFGHLANAKSLKVLVLKKSPDNVRQLKRFRSLQSIVRWK